MTERNEQAPGARRRAEPPAGGPGRRASTASRRIDVAVVLALVLPAIVAIAVTVIGSEDDPPLAGIPPVEAPLSASTLFCPPAPDPDGRPVVALRTPGVPGGEVRVSAGQGRLHDAGSLAVPDAVPVVVPGSADAGAVVLEAAGAAAPGLVAGRREPGVAAPCLPSAYDEWFLGLGASARNASVLRLVNPDGAHAVVDVTLAGPKGPIVEDAVRDISVPGHSVVEVDLAEVAPRTVDLAAHVQVTRGRAAVSVWHRFDPLSGGRVTADHLPAQTQPSDRALLLGVQEAGSRRMLFVANPGDDEVRSQVEVVTADATFAPDAAEEIVVPPGAVKRVSLDSLIDARAAEGMLGIAVESTGPVVTTVRGFVADDLTAVGALQRLDDPVSVVVPEADRARLVVGGAQRSGVVHVTAFDDDGTVLADDERIEISADRAADLSLPDGTAALVLEARNTPISAAVVVEGPGYAVVPVTPVELRARVPDVMPR